MTEKIIECIVYKRHLNLNCTLDKNMESLGHGFVRHGPKTFEFEVSGGGGFGGDSEQINVYPAGMGGLIDSDPRDLYKVTVELVKKYVE
jgi:hypothetical protein